MNNAPRPSTALYGFTRSANIPLVCTFELTRRCNLKCRHCYLGHGRPPAGELTTVQVKHVLRQLARTGTLTLAFTGGEIFLRRDILQLCDYARKLGFDLRLFTNGTMITADAARSLSALSLGGVDISLYGKRDTHDRITGVRGSFDASVRSIELLRTHGVRVTLKTPLMTLNIDDYPWLLRFARRHKAGIKFDPILTPQNNGNRDVLRYRLPLPVLSELYRDRRLFMVPDPDETAIDLTCSAGRNLCAVGHNGTLYPCIQLPLPLGNLKMKRFADVWSGSNRSLNRYRKIGNRHIRGCRSCSDAAYCQRCPGIALLEDGSLYGPSKIACSTAKIIARLRHN